MSQGCRLLSTDFSQQTEMRRSAGLGNTGYVGLCGVTSASVLASQYLHLCFCNVRRCSDSLQRSFEDSKRSLPSTRAETAALPWVWRYSREPQSQARL